MAIPNSLSWGTLFTSLLLVVAAWLVARVLEWSWWSPRRLQRALREQGLQGTQYRFLHGDVKLNGHLVREAQAKPMPLNSHDIAPRIVPLFHHVIREYGKIAFTWMGPVPRVLITDPDLTMEVLSNKFGHFEKPKLHPLARLVAPGLVTYEGEKWAKHRKILNPAFHVEKLKRMLPAFYACTSELVSRWEKLVGANRSYEIDVFPEFQNYTADVISRSAFGSSYEEGRRIFQLQDEQAKLFVQAVQNVYIPGYRFLPTPANNRRKEIDREARALLRGIIEKREKTIVIGNANNDDLLGLLLESNEKHFQEEHKRNNRMTNKEVIDECKLFYFAGQETTSILLTWTMILLGMHSSWQEKAREEVLEVFGSNKPNYDGLNRLKIVTMILYEVLRLYPPFIMLHRRTYKTTKLGNVTFPAGVVLALPMIFLHHDPDYWGKDSAEFKPERFAEGVPKASSNKVPFFGFGWGPRICIGQNFALLEAKIGLSMILQRFSFELSPSYIHAPRTIITLQPQHGAPIILRRI